MADIIVNPTQDPDYKMFKYTGELSDKLTPEVKINIQDLVRTGFQDKYNELAQCVIFNIYSKFTDGTSGQQSLVFETNRGSYEIAIVGAGVVQGIGVITADSVVYNAIVGSLTITNVQQALDYLLYTPPTISPVTGGWTSSIYEVGVNPINSSLVVTGNRQVKNLSLVNLAFTRTAGTSANPSTTSVVATPSPASQLAVTATMLSSQINTVLDITIPSTYVATGNVYDTNIPSNNGANVASSKSLQLVHPMMFGSSSYDTYTNSLGNVQTQFNATFIPFSTTTLPVNYATVGISLPLYRNIVPKPVSIDVIHSNGLFTYFLFPQAYYSNLAALVSSFKIQDGSTNLNYSYDTDSSPDPSTEWRVRALVLNNGSLWSGIPYYLVTSKVFKPKLTLRYIF